MSPVNAVSGPSSVSCPIAAPPPQSHRGAVGTACRLTVDVKGAGVPGTNQGHMRPLAGCQCPGADEAVCPVYPTLELSGTRIQPERHSAPAFRINRGVSRPAE